MPMPPLFDSHCHFDFPRFDRVREQEWREANRLGVRGLVIPGVRRPDWPRVQSMAKPDKGIWYCLGIHPWYVHEHGQPDLDALEQALAARSSGCVGVGECGLDALHGELAIQEPWFRAQLDIAARHGQPLVIHSVKTHDRLHGILRETHWQGRALVHGFSGSYQQARKLVDLGCYIGVGGVITHARARKTRDAVARLPIDALVLETDAPDMAPAGVARGQNSPVYLPDIFHALVELTGHDREALAGRLLDNARGLWGLDVEALPFRCAPPK